ncbi:hypothetical protein NDU88_003914 [Pleurodeles waltl]|uniref:Secreted protein n=1 Tax=Pleurodeles waltl TaxID=8319 RepID=A0AAV7TQ10_PLEWA|nr:hypothetical protein NDU88_003914 [Pleurodeles waltl]
MALPARVRGRLCRCWGVAPSLVWAWDLAARSWCACCEAWPSPAGPKSDLEPDQGQQTSFGGGWAPVANPDG